MEKARQAPGTYRYPNLQIRFKAPSRKAAKAGPIFHPGHRSSP